MKTFASFINAYAHGLPTRCAAHLSSGRRAYDFKTFGYDFQDFIEEDMTAFAAAQAKAARAPICVVATNDRKNAFPDIEVRCAAWSDRPFAVDLKCANVQRQNRAPNNDLGAMDGIRAKVAPFEETYYLFVQYSSEGERYLVLDACAKPFYQFVGRAKDGLLSYREKDGMMRPVSFAAFDQEPWIATRAGFDGLLERTIAKRQMAIVEKMLERMDPDAAREVMAKLAQRFGIKALAHE